MGLLCTTTSTDPPSLQGRHIQGLRILAPRRALLHTPQPAGRLGALPTRRSPRRSLPAGRRHPARRARARPGPVYGEHRCWHHCWRTAVLCGNGAYGYGGGGEGLLGLVDGSGELGEVGERVCGCGYGDVEGWTEVNE